MSMRKVSNYMPYNNYNEQIQHISNNIFYADCPWMKDGNKLVERLRYIRLFVGGILIFACTLAFLNY